MLEHGGFVALGLLVIWVALLVPLARGDLKVTPFSAASIFLALMIPFFWLAPGITEFTITKIGSFKTNAEEAFKYFEEIKTIRAKIETEAQAVNAAVTTLKTDIAQAQGETEKLKERLSPRHLTDEQVTEVANSVRKYAGQKASVMTYWDNQECAGLAHRIFETLRSANWDMGSSDQVSFSPGSWRRPPPPGPRLKNGIVINVNSPPEKTQNAAKALVDALNQAKMDADESYVETQWSRDDIIIAIGTRPDFP